MTRECEQFTKPIIDAIMKQGTLPQNEVNRQIVLAIERLYVKLKSLESRHTMSLALHAKPKPPKRY
jgi:hypothetical protein